MMSMVMPETCEDFDPFPETEEAEQGNLELYLDACTQLGIETLFEPADLLSEPGNHARIVENLKAFAQAAFELGFDPVELPPPPSSTEDSVVNAPVTPAPVPAPSASAKPPAGPASPRKAASPKPVSPRKSPVTAPAAVKRPAPPPTKVARPKAPPPKNLSRKSQTRPSVASAAPAEPMPPSSSTEPAESADVTEMRGRGETEMLMEWKPPSATSSDEAVRLENTRLKAQAERAEFALTSQTKLKEDAMAKLAKEKEKVRALEEELEEAKRASASAAAESGSSTKDKKLIEDLRIKLKSKMELLEQEKAVFDECAKDLEEQVTMAKMQAEAAEAALKQLQLESQAREEQAAKEIRQLEDDALFLTGELNRYKEIAAAAEDGPKEDPEKAALAAKVAKLESRLAARDAEVTELKQALDKANKNHAEEIDALRSLQSLKGADDGELDRLKVELAQIREELEQERTEQQNEMLELKAELEEARAKAEKAASAVASPRIEKSLPVPRKKSSPRPPAAAEKAPPRAIPSRLNDALLDSADLSMELPTVSSIIEERPGIGGARGDEAEASGEVEQGLRDLFAGEYAELEAGEFDSAENRALFVRTVEEQVKEDDVVELKGAEFENLVEIVQLMIGMLDFESPEDFEVAKTILKVGSVFRNEGKFLREMVGDNPLFTEPIFWDDLCVERISAAFESDPPEDQIDEIMLETLRSVALLMGKWTVPQDVIVEVISRAAENEGFLPEDADEIIADAMAQLDEPSGAPPPKQAPAAKPKAASGNAASNKEKRLSRLSARKPTMTKQPLPTVGRAVANGGDASGSDSVVRSGPLKFKKGSKWIKALFTLTSTKLLYEYVEDGIGEFGDEVILTSQHQASAGSDQAPGALRNYSFKLIAGDSALHLLAAKQPEVNEWIRAIMECCQKQAGGAPISSQANGAPISSKGKAAMLASVGKAAGLKRVEATPPAAVASAADLRKGSQPPVRIERSETAQRRLVKEGDVKMLVQKRWLRTHVELFDRQLVLTYIDPVDNASQRREDLPLAHLLIAPNSPLAPAALKDSSWRIKDAEDEYHMMSNSKTDATGWLTQIKTSRDALKK